MTIKENLELFELYKNVCAFKAANPKEEKIRMDCELELREYILHLMEALCMRPGCENHAKRGKK